MKLFCCHMLFVIAIISCGIKTPQMDYSYTDQNNNSYYISETEIRYIPITPSESSSGVYSGGNKKNVSISKAQFSEISEKCDAIFNTPNLQTSQRRMMTSILRFSSSSESKKIILTPSEKRKELEHLLKELCSLK
ncbi:hypothetical protein [Patiriisocius hiemis]|uniref:Lipoprotein n=1 Tax=Patiriisocius hiemis TaxID=3075604 RepID=A0ABU2YGB9_9FLAO|nr:hypothetical protein [Constantimarinum sp. W242]MDT0556093.1 hypothetical protein [Constantimarinum sp. W242]